MHSASVRPRRSPHSAFIIRYSALCNLDFRFIIHHSAFIIQISAAPAWVHSGELGFPRAPPLRGTSAPLRIIAARTKPRKSGSGDWHVADSQTGYCVATLQALETIDLDALYPRYGFPNDMLVQLNIYGFRVHDVPIKPVYGVGERSGIKLWKVIPTLSWLLLRRFWYRMFQKYVIHDTHPLVLFYITGLMFILVGFVFGLLQVIARINGTPPSVATTVLSALLLISGIQFVFFAMWFDMDYNRDLR